MIAVLDASAAMELVFKRPFQGRVEAEIEHASAVIAPELYISEVSNAFWKYSRLIKDARILDVRLLDAAIDLVDNYAPTRELYREAYAFSCQWNHPVYDSMYVVLTRRNDAILVSIDKRLRDLAGKNKLKTFSLK